MLFESAAARLPRPLLIEAAYYAARLIGHRGIIADVPTGHVATGLPGEPSDAAIAAAIGFIREIERQEGVPLEMLSWEAADTYITLLWELARARSTEESKLDKSRGKALLADLAGSASGL